MESTSTFANNFYSIVYDKFVYKYLILFSSVVICFVFYVDAR